MTTDKTRPVTAKAVEQKWNNYVDKFLSEDSLELQALREGGLLKRENRNILEHLLKARIETEVLCGLMGVTGKEKENIVMAATIHDAYVVDEKVYIREKTKKGEPADYRDLQFIKKQSAKRLLAIGFNEDVIKLADENITHEDGGPKETPSEIFFFVDANLDGREIIDIPQRVEKTRRGWRSDKGMYDEETAKGTQKYWNEFFKGAPGHGSRPHDKVQLESAARICRELASRLRETQPDTKNPEYEYIFGPDGDPNMLPYYVKDKVNENLMNL